MYLIRRPVLAVLFGGVLAATALAGGKHVFSHDKDEPQEYAMLTFDKPVTITKVDPEGQFSDKAAKVHRICWGELPYKSILKDQEVTVHWKTQEVPPIKLKSVTWYDTSDPSDPE